MPFTLSHAAAVLPGIRRDGSARGPLLASVLVMGSFSPDMTYFAATAVPGAMEFGNVTHAPLGLLTVDVAITAALLAVWLMVREPLVALVPARWQGRVHAFLRGRGQPAGGRGALVLRFYVSAVVGAGTHIVWDSFTHHDRWGTRVLPVLNEKVAGLPLHSYAQYGTSALALVALVWFVASALRLRPAAETPAAPPAPTPAPTLDGRGRWLAGMLLGLCVLLGVVQRCARWYTYYGRVDSPLDIIPTACFGAGAGLAVGLLLYGVVMRLREHAIRV
ncbi:DUF4184 family protein [Streptomyces sp. NBC_00210]|uniref:DUF4184 family protein n=1 Tax=unclassified Streptomyces TaxID=2593676 RepID=UPI00324743E4